MIQPKEEKKDFFFFFKKSDLIGAYNQNKLIYLKKNFREM